MDPGSRLPPINDFKYGARVKSAFVLFREKGQIGGLGVQRRTAWPCSFAVDPVAFSTVGNEIGLAYVGVLRDSLRVKFDEGSQNDSAA
jgi:hypothetical protein